MNSQPQTRSPVSVQLSPLCSCWDLLVNPNCALGRLFTVIITTVSAGAGSGCTCTSLDAVVVDISWGGEGGAVCAVNFLLHNPVHSGFSPSRPSCLICIVQNFEK